MKEVDNVLNTDNYNILYKTLQGIDFKKVCIHSDMFYGFKFVKGLSREQQLQCHYDVLKSVVDQRPVWMPSFNYDYPATKEFNVQRSPSQVGALTEYFRTHIANWRSLVPIFSFTGDDSIPILEIDKIIDPFGEKSLFQQMIWDNTLIIHYGINGIHSSTIIHYCERMSGKLYYRYDKIFSGRVISKDKIYDIDLNFHVRPKSDKILEYDWKRLEKDLIQTGLMIKLSDFRFEIRLVNAADLANFWINKMQEDPLYLLDTDSLAWVEPKLEELGRPFLLSDFE
jgi:aminoglycoside 3-N-acetyltransferase